MVLHEVGAEQCILTIQEYTVTNQEYTLHMLNRSTYILTQVQYGLPKPNTLRPTEMVQLSVTWGFWVRYVKIESRT